MDGNDFQWSFVHGMIWFIIQVKLQFLLVDVNEGTFEKSETTKTK